MALIPCPECGRQISTSAASCPGCGCPAAANDAGTAPAAVAPAARVTSANWLEVELHLDKWERGPLRFGSSLSEITFDGIPVKFSEEKSTFSTVCWGPIPFESGSHVMSVTVVCVTGGLRTRHHRFCYHFQLLLAELMVDRAKLTIDIAIDGELETVGLKKVGMNPENAGSIRLA